MSRPLRTTVLVVAGFLIAFSIGCAPMTVSSHVDRSADFARYRTYDWGPADALPTGDPRLDKNPFFKDHFQGAVERRLAARGWELAASAAPDLLIHYHANISQRFDLDRVDRQDDYCPGDDCSGRLIEYEAGTLVLDMVDVKTQRVIWRGWAQSTMDGIVDNPDRMEQMINQAVARMLERLPRTLQLGRVRRPGAGAGATGSRHATEP